MSTADYEKTMAVNLDGVWFCMKYELAQMREQGFGAIVNNSSLGGLLGNPGRAPYHATKHAILGLTKCAAVENAARGIQINAVCPGTIDTPMVRALMERENLTEEFFAEKQPIARLGRPEEVAVSGPLAVQPGRQPGRRPRSSGGWWLHDRVSSRSRTGGNVGHRAS